MNKHEIKSAATKHKIVEVYLDLLKTKNIDEITIQEITERAGYNRGTFYVHYRSIYDLHYQIKHDFIENARMQVQMILAEHPVLNFEVFFEKITSIFIENEKISIPLITRDSKFPEDVKRAVKPVMKQYFPRAYDGKGFDYLLEYHLSSIFGVARFWIARGKDLPVEELFALFQKVVTRGVFTVLVNGDKQDRLETQNEKTSIQDGS